MRHKAARALAADDAAFLSSAAQDWGTDPETLARTIIQRAERIKNLQQTRERADKPMLEFLARSHLRAFVPPDGWNLVGNHHIQRGSPFVVGGAPSVGKSHAATALAVAGATGADWFGLPVHQKFRMMIFQAENDPVRLKDEYGPLDSPVLNQYIRVCMPPPFEFTFDNREFSSQLQAAIDEFRPDVFIVTHGTVRPPTTRARTTWRRLTNCWRFFRKVRLLRARHCGAHTGAYCSNPRRWLRA